MLLAISLFLMLITFIILGIPIAFSLGLSSLLASLMADVSPLLIIQRVFATFETFPFQAIFLFTLMGSVLARTGIAEIIINFIESLMGHIHGGLGIITIWSSACFGALTGSSPGTVAAIGSIMIPQMTKRGYPLAFAAALAAVSGMLGQLIPPSICAITFGIVMNVSIGKLFIAMIGPGLALAFVLSVTCYVISKKHGYKGHAQKYSGLEKWNLLLKSSPGVILPIAVIGGIYGGIVTPTEGGALGAVVAITLATTVYRKESSVLKEIRTSFIEASITSATILMIISFSSAFTYFFSIGQIPDRIAQTILQSFHNPVLILIVFNLLLLFLGMFLEANAIIIMLGPLISSLFIPLGVDMIFIGVMVVFNMMIGCVTPPLGVNLYVASGVGKIKFEKLSIAVLPFVFVCIGVLIVLFVALPFMV